MESGSKLDVNAFVSGMLEPVEAALREMVEAVNKAPDGAWISDSEMQVRDSFARLRQETYEKLIQGKMDAAQAAFPPGGQSHGQAFVEQGGRKQKHVDGQR